MSVHNRVSFDILLTGVCISCFVVDTMLHASAQIFVCTQPSQPAESSAQIECCPSQVLSVMRSESGRYHE